MGIRIRESNNINILDVEGRIDINSSDIIETVGWLTTTGKVNLIMNLENVDTVDYSGLSILAIAYKNAVNHRGVLKFLHTPLHVTELFKVAKLDAVFEFYDEEDAAINSFRKEEIAKAHLRRKFKRLDIHLGVRYKISGGGRKAMSFEGQVLNISAAGIYVYTPHTFPINSLLDLELSFPGANQTLEAAGRVIWLTDKEIQAHCYPGMGVSFVHLTAEKEKAIVDFIDKNITRRTEPF